MSKQDILRKLASRKFWACVAGFVAGLIIYFGGTPERAEATRGLILSGASIIVYMLAEGVADAMGAGTVFIPSDEEAEE